MRRKLTISTVEQPFIIDVDTGMFLVIKVIFKYKSSITFKININRESLIHLEQQGIKDSDVADLIINRIKMDVNDETSELHTTILDKYKLDHDEILDVAIHKNIKTNKLIWRYF